MRILDRQRIERVLNDAPDTSSRASPSVVMSLASLEVWLQTMSRPASRVAA